MNKKALRRRISLVVLGVVCVVLAGRLGNGFLSLSDAARLASCRPSLLLVMCERCGEEHEGMYPALSDESGRLMFDASKVPLFCDIRDTVCDSDPGVPASIRPGGGKDTLIDDWSYIYLGYFIENEQQGEAFIKKYKATAGQKDRFVGDLEVEQGAGNCGTNKLYRLRSIKSLPPELECMKSRAALVPVIIEWPGNHRRGGKVVYLDGHEKFVPYPGKFPMTREFIDALRGLDAGAVEASEDACIKKWGRSPIFAQSLPVFRRTWGENRGASPFFVAAGSVQACDYCLTAASACVERSSSLGGMARSQK
jgi:hypothetical protein